MASKFGNDCVKYKPHQFWQGLSVIRLVTQLAAGNDPSLGVVALGITCDNIVVVGPFMRIHKPAVAALLQREGAIWRFADDPLLGCVALGRTGYN